MYFQNHSHIPVSTLIFGEIELFLKENHAGAQLICGFPLALECLLEFYHPYKNLLKSFNLGKRRLEEVSNGIPELDLVPVVDHLGVVVEVAGPQPGIEETTYNKGQYTPPARCTLTFNTTPSTPETICS